MKLCKNGKNADKNIYFTEEHLLLKSKEDGRTNICSSTIRVLDSVYRKKHFSQEEIGKKNTGLNLYVSVPRIEGCTTRRGRRKNTLML